jgi:hypothetical protein
MVVEEVFANCYNFNPFTKSKKVRYLIFKVSYNTIQSRGWSRSCNSDLWLLRAGPPKEIFLAP